MQKRISHLSPRPLIAQDHLNVLINSFAIAFIMTGAALVAENIWLHAVFEAPANTVSPAHEPLLLLIPAAAALLMFPILYGLRRALTPVRRLFLTLIAATLVSALIWGTLRAVSPVQIALFVAASISIGWLTILLPQRARRYGSLRNYLVELQAYRPLLHIMIDYNVRSRYSQKLLGTLWIIFLPLSHALVYAFVFTQFFQRVVPEGTPFIAFYLSAIVAWDFFSQGVVTGMNALSTNAAMIHQVYFPREILVLVKLGEDYVDFAVAFAVLIIINLLSGLWPTLTWLYLIPVMGILTLLVLGFMLFLSYLSVYVRDIPQLVGVMLRLMFFLTPIIYTADRIPERFRFLTVINPLAPIIEAFRQIIVFGQPPDFTALYYPAVTGCVLVYVGYLFFKFRQRNLADYI